jgi:hypothetical protein
MLTILDLADNIIYAENPLWECDPVHSSGQGIGQSSPIKLGIVLEALDTGEGEFSYAVDAFLLPQIEYIDPTIIDEARVEGAESQEEIILYVYETYGGVPVNIDALQPPKASCGFSSFIADSRIASVGREQVGACDEAGERWEGGEAGEIEDEAGESEEMEVRRFPDADEAMVFARDFYAVYAGVLFRFIDMVLDNPLRTGETGRERMRQLSGRFGPEK